MRSSALALVAIAVSTGLAACGGAAAAPSIGGGPGAVQQSRNPTVITAEELSTAAPGDLYTVIQRLRPAFLQTRGTATFGNGTGPEVIKVYVENVERGDVTALHDINSFDVQEVRRLSPTEAIQRFGMDNNLGAIVVTLKRR